MSGTSLDGLDLAYCIFNEVDGHWSFSIERAETIPYSQQWKNRLTGLMQATKEEILSADIDLGEYIGEAVKGFIAKHGLKIDFVASHGHTIYHEPERKLTLQIGHGARISSINGLTVIYDFRSKDVSMGGQGAPLVPVGDRMLFGKYGYCLNLGGIANVSFEAQGRRTAFDICPANMVLNRLAEENGQAFDDHGAMAKEGHLIPGMLKQLESLSYYQLSGPRSLGREWVEENIFPILTAYKDHGTQQLLATFTEHIACRVSDVIPYKGKSMLVTGGGAYNDYLMSRLQHHCDARIEVPGNTLVEYKEAMIFAFLGLLRLKGINNVLGSVTGAGKDHCSGKVIYP